jgi:hypothetical protein
MTEQNQPGTPPVEPVGTPQANNNPSALPAPPVDPPVDPAQVSTDDVELDGKVIRPSFLENLTNKPTEPGSLPDDIRQELERLRGIEAKYNELTSDTLFSAVSAYKQAGGSDINVFIEKVSGSAPDPEKMTPLEIFEYDLRNNLAKEAQMSEDEIEEAIQYFAEKPKFEQVHQIKDAKKRLAEARANHLSKVNTELSGQAAQQLQNSEERARQEREAASAFENTLDSLVGKTWHRLPVTKERADEVKQLAQLYCIRNPKTGLPDVEATIQFALPFLYLEEILKANIRYGRDRGLEEGANIGKGSNGVTRNVVTRQSPPTDPDNDPYERWKAAKQKKQNSPA